MNSASGQSRIKILVLAANPRATNPLQLGREIREIRDEIRVSEFRDVLDLIPCFAFRATDLQQTLLQTRPDIVHFSGHGTRAGELVLEGAAGSQMLVGTQALARLLHVLKDNIRVVVLNTCHSRQLAQEISRHVDCVIGMDRALGDEAAIAFAAAFYRAIGFGRCIHDAFALGCSAIELEGLTEESTPRLFLKAGIDAKELVLVGGVGAPPPRDMGPRRERGGSPGRGTMSIAGALMAMVFGASAGLYCCVGPGAARLPAPSAALLPPATAESSTGTQSTAPQPPSAEPAAPPSRSAAHAKPARTAPAPEIPPSGGRPPSQRAVEIQDVKADNKARINFRGTSEAPVKGRDVTCRNDCEVNVVGDGKD